jgi:hypothetical protein
VGTTVDARLPLGSRGRGERDTPARVEFPTEVKEILTPLGKSRRSISSAMGVRITRGINLAGFFKRHVFELEGR